MKPLVRVLCLVLLIMNFQTSVFCSSLSSPPATNNSVCSPWENAALLQFKEDLTSDGSVCPPSTYNEGNKGKACCASESCDETRAKVESWKEGTDCCTWEGVTCDNFAGHVIDLDLGCSCLSGTFSSNNTLFSLRHLQRLNLVHNSFQGSSLPSKFSQFTSLTHLNLSSSGFLGQVPSQISRLNKLLSLDLSGNRKLTLDTHALREMVENLTEVRQLFLDWMDMSSIDPSIFRNLSSSLTHLSLIYTRLSGKFPENTFRPPNLIMLHLGVNNHLIPQLPKSNWSGPLESLVLSETSFTDEFPNSIVHLVSLRHLGMSHCFCSGSLPRELGNLNKLLYLDLSQNQIKGVIPSSFVKLTQLQYLDFSNNRLSGHLNEFSSTSLEHLGMNNNRLQGPVPNSISYNLNLTHLDLSSNNFIGIVDLQMFSKVQRLTHLVLSRNNLSLVFYVNVSYKFSHLYSFGLSSCNINQIPTIVVGESNVELAEFDFSNNRIQDIPVGKIRN